MDGALLDPRDVVIAVPTRGAIGWQTVQRLAEIRDAHPALPPIMWQEGNLSVAQTRNRIVKRFLATPAQTLVMVDDDIVPPPAMLERLLPLPDGYGMVAIPHAMPHPGNPGELLLTAFNRTPAGLSDAALVEGLNDVDAVATGCVAISRAALVELGPHPFRITDDPDETPASDDFAFCDDLRAAGYRIGSWFDGWYCDHLRVVGLAPLFEAQTRDHVRSAR